MQTSLDVLKATNTTNGILDLIVYMADEAGEYSMLGKEGISRILAKANRNYTSDATKRASHFLAVGNS